MSSPFESVPFNDRLPLARYEIDRDYLVRDDPAVFDTLFADPATRVLLLMGGSALLAGPNELALLDPEAVSDPDLLVYLGRTTSDADDAPAGTPIVAAVVSDAGREPDRYSAEGEWGSLRTLGATLSDRDAGLFVEALAMANWHATHAFSPRTGEPTLPGKGGWVRIAPDGHEMFPRTDAAIIVGVVDTEDRMLMGHNALWEGNRWSVLAGFVEPGENLESAVKREVFEESGLRVIDPVYLGSQPWPFPASLMLGYLARVDPATDGALVPDGAEIQELRFFSRDDLVAEMDSIWLPGRTSIARAILEEWFGGAIEDTNRW